MPALDIFAAVTATPAERREARAGDALVTPADVVMDRAFTVAASPETVWPWLLQLGKQRAGWYLPRGVELLLPRGRRATRTIVPQWQQLGVGDVIPDYGGRHATFTVAELDPPSTLVYWARRHRTELTWSITLRQHNTAAGSAEHTRVLLRLRLSPVRRAWLATTAGDLVDLLTVAGMAAGLRERLAPHATRESASSPLDHRARPATHHRCPRRPTLASTPTYSGATADPEEVRSGLSRLRCGVLSQSATDGHDQILSGKSHRNPSRRPLGRIGQLVDLCIGAAWGVMGHH
jgi:hypothetical protein